MVLASARYCFKCSSVKSESYSRTMGAFLINVLQILITVYTSPHFTYPLAALILAFKIYPKSVSEPVPGTTLSERTSPHTISRLIKPSSFIAL